MNLQDSLTRAAGPHDAGFDHHDVERRVARRHRTRRRARLAAGAASLVVAFGLGALVALVADRRGGDPDGVRTGPVAGADQDLAPALAGTWRLRGVSTGPGVVGEVVLVLRHDGAVSGTNPCGTLRADDWSVAAGHLVLEGVVTASHRCLPDAGRVETLLLEVLASQPEVGRGEDGGDAEGAGPAGDRTTLRLTAPNGTYVVFERDAPPAERPEIGDTLPDGRTWALADSVEHGLCVTLDEVDVGCEDDGDGIVAAGDDPTSPRRVGSGAVVLLVGRLPAGAEQVVLEHDDGRPADPTTLALDSTTRLWGIPVAPDDVPDLVRYLTSEGRQISSHELDT